MESHFRRGTHSQASCRPRTGSRPANAVYRSSRPVRPVMGSFRARPNSRASDDVVLRSTTADKHGSARNKGPRVDLRAQLAATVPAVAVLFPAASAAGESLPPSAADALEAFLGGVQALGPWGPVAFIATISIMECVPLFPTQPLTIGAGILFGASGGAACNLVGLCSAATLAFTISKRAGRKNVENVVAEETQGKAGGVLQHQLASVNDAIESGSTTQQFFALLFLRLTPIVPFSASNYVLGLSPITYPPFIAATFTGMILWSTVFATLGAGARGMLTSGVDLSAVIGEVSADAGEIAEKVLAAGALLGVVVFAYSWSQRQDEGAPQLSDEDRPSSMVGKLKERVKIGAGAVDKPKS